jgi:hypothetical protein
MYTPSATTSTTRRKLMKNQRRFKAPNCRGGRLSRKFRGAAVPARRGGPVAVSTREKKFHFFEMSGLKILR